MPVCPSLIKPLDLEDEKVNFKENLLFMNNWFLKNFSESQKLVVFYLVGFFMGGNFFQKRIL